MEVIIPIASYEDGSTHKRHKCAVTVTLRHYQSHFSFFETSAVHTTSQPHTASSWQATLQPYFSVLAQWLNAVAGLVVVANSFISWMRKYSAHPMSLFSCLQSKESKELFGRRKLQHFVLVSVWQILFMWSGIHNDLEQWQWC